MSYTEEDYHEDLKEMESLVIDGDRIYFDEVSEFTKEQVDYLTNRLESITTRGGVTYFDSVEEAVGYVSEEKPKQKPSTLLLNLMRNI